MIKHQPPHLAEKFFRWYCRHASIEDLQGDVEELFYYDLKTKSLRYARLRYWQRILSLMFSYAIKRRKQKSAFHQYSKSTVNFSMISNYMLIAIRSLSKHKLFAAINVFGLAIGMSISLLFIAMLSFLFTYDDFHVNNENVYRIISHVQDHERNPSFASTPPGFAEKLRNDFSGNQHVVQINSTLGGTVKYEQKEIPLNGYFVNPEFLNVFSFSLLKGNINTVLDKPNTLVITQRSAEKIFGAADPIGKVIEIEGQGLFEITGILKDTPRNSHMQFEILSSYKTFELLQQNVQDAEPWKNYYNSYIYLLVPERQNLKNIEQFLNHTAEQIYKEDKNTYSATFELQPMNKIVPGRDLFNELGTDWGYSGLIIFGALTLLILLPACFNYANISISRALKRMKEIGLRKTMGGQRSQIFLQFITETVIITFVGLILSYFIFITVRPEFISMIVGGSTILDLSLTWQMIACFIGFTLLVGLIAGIVPALYFSKLNPIEALKVKPASRKPLSGFTLRKSLIVLQFALSLGFIMSVVVVLSQYRYAMNYDFGFQKENILDVDLQNVSPQVFKNEFSRLSSVQSMSLSSHIIGTQSTDRDLVLSASKSDSSEAFTISIDENYLSNFHLTLIAGKNFTSDPSFNKNHILVNEEFVKEMGFENVTDALDQTIIFSDGREVLIGGVLKNFHYMSLQEPIRSFFFQYSPEKFRYANLTVVSKDVYGDISNMASVWKTFGGEQKFEAEFFNDEIKQAYSVYFSMIKICGFLGLLAITISCLGLLGMVVFTVENRTKEVGVRKVMGASSASIIILLSKDFARLMAIAAFIAIPITWYFFEGLYFKSAVYYSLSIGFAEISLSILIMALLGLMTILSQTAKAARVNPVDTLRHE